MPGGASSVSARNYRQVSYAWCRERQAFRYFKLSRMQDSKVLAQGFDSDYSHLTCPQIKSEVDLRPVSSRSTTRYSRPWSLR